jgi:undecaprenyl-diphosphatase
MGNKTAWLILIVAALGFVLVTVSVWADWTDAWDARAVRAFRVPGHPEQTVGPTWLRTGMMVVTDLGSLPVAGAIAALVAIGLATHRRRHAAVLILAATGGALLLNFLLKEICGRPRPAIVPHLVWAQLPSFPSGHAMVASAVYLTLGALLARVLPRWHAAIMVTAAMLTGLVGLSRVFLGVHYPTDVIAGFLAGIAWATICWMVTGTLQRRGKVEKAVDQ